MHCIPTDSFVRVLQLKNILMVMSKKLCQLNKWYNAFRIACVLPYNTEVINGTTMVTDTAQDKQIRHSIVKAVEDMDLRLLQRIAYEVRCEEMGLYPDGWKLYPEE